MKLIYANVAWFIFIVFGIAGATIQRHSTLDRQSMSDIIVGYDLLFGSVAVYLIICVLGLIKKTKWSYSFSVSANSTLALLPLSIFVASLFMLFPDIGFAETLKMNVANLVVGFISLYFWVSLSKYKKKLEIG